MNRIAYAFAALTVLSGAMAGVVGYTAFTLATGDYLVFDYSIEILSGLAGFMVAISAYSAVSTAYYAARRNR